jgi:hypothetical protein
MRFILYLKRIIIVICNTCASFYYLVLFIRNRKDTYKIIKKAEKRWMNSGTPLARKQDNLSADSCFSDLILYMAISRHFFLIHEVMNIHETIVTRLNFFNIFITKKSILLCLYPLNRHLEFLFDHVHNYFYFKRCQTGRKIYHFASHQQ